MNHAPLRHYRISEKTKFHHKDTKNTKKLTTNGSASAKPTARRAANRSE
jgi:hypothetical protein